MWLADQNKEEFSRVAHLQGIAATAAVLALPALSGDLAWLHSLVPLPVFYYLVALGQKQGLTLLTAGILVAGIVSALLGTLPDLFFAVTLLPVGFLLARAASRHESLTWAGLQGVFLLALTWLLFGLLYAVSQQANPYREILQNLDQGLTATFELYKQSSDLPADTAKEIAAGFEKLRFFLNKSFPAIVMTSMIFTVWLNLAAGNWLLKKKNPGLAPWGDLKEWRLPEPLVWLIIVAVAALITPIQALNTAGLNLGLVLGVLYFMQGVAILSCFLAKWSIPPFFKAVIYTLLLIQIYGVLLLAIIGLVDVWFDLRRQRQNVP